MQILYFSFHKSGSEIEDSYVIFNVCNRMLFTLLNKLISILLSIYVDPEQILKVDFSFSRYF